MSDRIFEISNMGGGTSGCCGLDELYGFVEKLGDKKDKPVTDSEWLGALVTVLVLEMGGADLIGPIVLFSGNDEQEKFKFSPQAMAKWLIDKGENVVSTARVKNNNSGHMIQAFLWTPSRRFKNLLIKTQKKNNKESDNEPRANVA